MNTPALILVHGYPLDHTMWEQVISFLPADIKVIAPDLRGFGGQPAGSEEPSIDRMADDIARLLDKENIGRVIIAGMSMGGYVALAFAEHYKDRLAGLALVNSQSTADTAEARAGRLALVQRVRREGVSIAAQAVLPKLFAPQNAEKPEFSRFALQGTERAGIEGIVWALEAMANRPDRTEVLKNLHVPTLILHSAKDQFIPARRIREFAKDIPGAQYVEIKEAGHCSPIEAPDQVAKALKKLVQRTSASVSAPSSTETASLPGAGVH